MSGDAAFTPIRQLSPAGQKEDRLAHPNIFRETFGSRSDAEWLAILQRSVREPVIEDIGFPRFPDPKLQSIIHGNDSEQAIQEAFRFYSFIRSQLGDRLKLGPGERMLDFGSGWGRMLRPFMRHFDLADIYGFEPTRMFCTVARELNPYVCFLGGEYLPNRRIPRDAFDLIIGYSVFSHLSPHAASLWLREVAELLRPGGFAVFTTWGERFLTHLVAEKARLEAGAKIHWYHELNLQRFGDVEGMVKRCRAGQFVWVDVGDPMFGEAFLGPAPLRALISENLLPLEIVTFDARSLPQDAFILRRT